MESGQQSTAEQFRARLTTDFGVAGAFARAEQVAHILGISASCVRTQARLGKFPIPHRRIGKAMLFPVEAVVEWYGREDAQRAPIAAAAAPIEIEVPRQAALAQAGVGGELATEARSALRRARAPAQPCRAPVTPQERARVDRIKQEALAAALLRVYGKPG